MSDIAAINAKLDVAANLMFAKDMAIIDELWSDGFRLVGSEEGEIAATRDELVAVISAIFAQPFRLRWVFNDKSFNIENDIAWVFAQLTVELVFPDNVVALPYRLVTIFRRVAGEWQWRLYSGSEPVPPRIP